MSLKVQAGDLLVYRDRRPTDPLLVEGGKWGELCLITHVGPCEWTGVQLAEYLDTEGKTCVCDVKDLRTLDENWGSCER